MNSPPTAQQLLWTRRDCTSSPLSLDVEDVLCLGLPLLLEVDGEDGVAARGLVVHVGRGRRAVKGALLQALHSLLLRGHGPRSHADLQGRGGKGIQAGTATVAKSTRILKTVKIVKSANRLSQ